MFPPRGYTRLPFFDNLSTLNWLSERFFTRHSIFRPMTEDRFFCWKAGNREFRRGAMPILMGIVNVTPDSFSDGGTFDQPEAAVAHALQLVEDGADIIDIGGESTRPGAGTVSESDELARTIPVIERLTKAADVTISIDTTKAEVARQAIQAGALIVNDISGLTFDPAMISVCAGCNVGVCVMHIQGRPQTMQDDPRYGDVVADVTAFLQSRLAEAGSAGIAAERICLDPGIGFGKTAEHNLQLMRSIPDMKHQLQRPLLLGHSRKRFLSRVLGRSVEERLAGTIGVSIGLAENGADVLRVHDVRATRDALLARNAVAERT